MDNIIISEKTKVYYLPKIVKVPMCPKCNKQVNVVTDPDLMTMYTYKCGHCNYLE